MPDRPQIDVTAAWRDRRPLKRWRWVGCFADDVLLCAAVAYLGGGWGLSVSWWAVWDRERRTLLEHTAKRTGFVTVAEGRVAVEDGPVMIDLHFDEGEGVETISPHGRSYIWTRKQLVACTGTVATGDRVFEIAAPGLVDDSAGYHARRTRWWWSAGAGATTDGRAVAWNLVDGLHDAEAASERTVWVDGIPHHVEPQPFHGLDAVGALRFNSEATRTQRENRVLVATDYEQPFGSFAGSLPVAGRVTGLGVMERHDARW